MILSRVLRNARLGLGSLWLHRLRSALTTLGIVFGVASVICMLAIGEGLSFEAREQIRRLGSNNIILRSVPPPKESTAQASSGPGPQAIQYGLTYADVERIASTVPGIKVIVPTREIRKDVQFRSRSAEGMVVGTVPWYPDITSAHLLAGRFISSMDEHAATNVCVLSSGIAAKLTAIEAPLGNTVKIGSDHYRVVGIIESGAAHAGNGGELVSDTGREVYVPLTASRLRFGELIIDRQAGSFSAERVELHGAIVQVVAGDDVLVTSQVIQRLLNTHHSKSDYQMTVPLQLLREKERVKRIYNMVLGLMAAISLLVGGIGIMNIMLASVSERTAEIGIRRAVGAKKRDIMAQFLTETVLLSGIGGLVGVGLGVGLPLLITYFSGMATIVTAWAILLAFGISAMVGLIFGFYPAWRAANMDPIVALRHE
jgi:putative ABC transport system permease protein